MRPRRSCRYSRCTRTKNRTDHCPDATALLRCRLGNQPMDTTRSSSLYARASRLIPGGVNSPARAWTAVGGQPLFISRAQGPRIWDVDDNELIDFVGSWGPMILGHAHPRVIEAARQAASSGTSFGAPTEAELRMAELVTEALPSVEMVRFVNSGTEAAMSALRLARAHTGRSKILKFEGGYHGHDDALLVEAGSGVASHGIATSAGIHPEYAASTLVAPYNDLDAVRSLFATNRGEIAAVIVEPVAGNMGVVEPAPGFLEGTTGIDEQRRGSADLRRGDNRLPRPPRRRADDVRGRSRHHVPGQDHRRGISGGCVWRKRRDHAERRPTGIDVPGRHALGKPGGDGGGHSRAGGTS